MWITENKLILANDEIDFLQNLWTIRKLLNQITTEQFIQDFILTVHSDKSNRNMSVDSYELFTDTKRINLSSILFDDKIVPNMMSKTSR